MAIYNKFCIAQWERAIRRFADQVFAMHWQSLICIFIAIICVGLHAGCILVLCASHTSHAIHTTYSVDADFHT